MRNKVRSREHKPSCAAKPVTNSAVRAVAQTQNLGWPQSQRKRKKRQIRQGT